MGRWADCRHLISTTGRRRAPAGLGLAHCRTSARARGRRALGNTWAKGGDPRGSADGWPPRARNDLPHPSRQVTPIRPAAVCLDHGASAFDSGIGELGTEQRRPRAPRPRRDQGDCRGFRSRRRWQGQAVSATEAHPARSRHRPFVCEPGRAAGGSAHRRMRQLDMDRSSLDGVAGFIGDARGKRRSARLQNHLSRQSASKAVTRAPRCREKVRVLLNVCRRSYAERGSRDTAPGHHPPRTASAPAPPARRRGHTERTQHAHE